MLLNDLTNGGIPMPTVTVSKRFQVTIPVAIRHQLGIHTGDELEAVPTSEGILYKPKKKAPPDKEIIAYWKECINNEAGETVEITDGAREELEATIAQPSIGPFSSVEKMLADMNHRRKENRSDGTEL
jgi:AbrB family looped-hinge helix DNA binding protein